MVGFGRDLEFEMLLFCAAGLVVEEPKENEKQVTPQLSAQHIVQSTGRRRGKEVTRKSARTSEQRREKVRIKGDQKMPNRADN